MNFRNILSILLFCGEVVTLLIIAVLLFCVWVYPERLFFTLRYPWSASCLASSLKRECYGHVMQDYMQERDARYAQGFLISLFSNGLIDQNTCHTFAHYLGKKAVEHAPIEEVLAGAKTFCASGYMHGALEGIFKGEVEHGVLTSKIDRVCESVGMSFAAVGCFHGLGHALMYTTGHDVVAALHLCDAYEDGRRRSMCYDGVFMENVFASVSSFAGRSFLDSDNPLFPCRVVEQRYRPQCYWRSVPTQLLTRPHGRIASSQTVMAVAKDIPNDLVGFYWYGIGREVDTLMSGDRTKIRTFCSEFAEEGRISCLKGAAKHMVAVDGGDVFRANELCASLTEGQEQKSCTALLKNNEYPYNLASIAAISP